MSINGILTRKEKELVAVVAVGADVGHVGVPLVGLLPGVAVAAVAAVVAAALSAFEVGPQTFLPLMEDPTLAAFAEMLIPSSVGLSGP